MDIGAGNNPPEARTGPRPVERKDRHPPPGRVERAEVGGQIEELGVAAPAHDRRGLRAPPAIVLDSAGWTRSASRPAQRLAHCPVLRAARLTSPPLLLRLARFVHERVPPTLFP